MEHRHATRFWPTLLALALALFGVLAIAPSAALAEGASPDIVATGFFADGASAETAIQKALNSEADIDGLASASNVFYVVYKGADETNYGLSVSRPGSNNATQYILSTGGNIDKEHTDTLTFSPGENGLGYVWFSFVDTGNVTPHSNQQSGSAYSGNAATGTIAAATYNVDMWVANGFANAPAVATTVTVSGLTFAASPAAGPNTSTWTYSNIANSMPSTSAPSAGPVSVYGMPNATVTLPVATNVTGGNAATGKTLSGWVGDGTSYAPGATYTFGASGTVTLTPSFGATISLSLSEAGPGFAATNGTVYDAASYLNSITSGTPATAIQPNAEGLYSVALDANNTIPTLPVVVAKGVDAPVAFAGWYTYDPMTNVYTLHQAGETVPANTDLTLHPLLANASLAWTPTTGKLVEGNSGEFQLIGTLGNFIGTATGASAPQISPAAQSFFGDVVERSLTKPSVEAASGLAYVELNVHPTTSKVGINVEGSGATLTFTFTPAANYFVASEPDNFFTATAFVPTYVYGEREQGLSAQLSVNVYDFITVNVDPLDGGTVTQTVNASDQIQLVATPADGYTFRQWTNGQGQVVSNTAIYLVDNAANAPYTAWFTKTAADVTPVYRLYNPFDELHLFTTSANEYNTLLGQGWRNEGVAWNAPKYGTGAYTIIRLYNPYSHDHYYVPETNQTELDALTTAGWIEDGESSWFDSAAVGSQYPVYQLFNPYRQVDTHLWTLSAVERDACIREGWESNQTSIYAASPAS